MKTKAPAKARRLSTADTAQPGDLIAPARCRFLPEAEVPGGRCPTPEQDEAMWAALCREPYEWEVG